MKTLLALALAGVLLATPLVSGSALGAGTKKYGTHVTIHFTSSTYSTDFYGKVKSKKNACRRHRKVVVYREKHKKDTKISSTKSNRRGHWDLSLGGSPPRGNYFATAARKKLRHGSIICKKAISPTITAP